MALPRTAGPTTWYPRRCSEGKSCARSAACKTKGAPIAGRFVTIEVSPAYIMTQSDPISCNRYLPAHFWAGVVCGAELQSRGRRPRRPVREAGPVGPEPGRGPPGAHVGEARPGGPPQGQNPTVIYETPAGRLEGPPQAEGLPHNHC